jgi:hypothetical protein
MNSYPTITFTVEDRPPKKSDANSCWGSKEANYVLRLREKALEARTKAGMDGCFRCPVKIELLVYAKNLTNRKNTHDYVSDLDTLIAGILESLQPAANNPDIKINPIFDGRDEIGPKVPLIIEDDAQVVEIRAKKIESLSRRYILTISPTEIDHDELG